MLDLVEGGLDEDVADRVRDHLDECPSCREEADSLRAGLNGLRDIVTFQVGSGPHLTPSRREATLKAARQARKKTRLVTWRKFAGAAAAAMLLVSGFFLAQDLFSGAGQPKEGTRAGGGATAVIPRSLPRRGGSNRNGSPIRTVGLGGVGNERPKSDARGLPRRPPQPKDMMYNQPADIQVPVQNARYEPRRERYWW